MTSIANQSRELCWAGFPALWLETAGMVNGDLKKSGNVMRRALASSDHTAFVKKLSAAR